MLKWIAKRFSTDANQPEPVKQPARQHGRVMSGRYRLLYEYLEHRYANTVVLTFAEIEDLLGFALPGAARLQREWWANTDPTAEPLGYSDSWILASRTATPNLLARTVAFVRS